MCIDSLQLLLCCIKVRLRPEKLSFVVGSKTRWTFVLRERFCRASLSSTLNLEQVAREARKDAAIRTRKLIAVCASVYERTLFDVNGIDKLTLDVLVADLQVYNRVRL